MLFFEVMGWVEENSARMARREGGGTTAPKTSVSKEVKKKGAVKKR